MRREIQAKHRFITRTCRENKGDEACVREVIEEVREATTDLLRSWPAESGAVVHVRVSVEYGRDG